MRPKQKAEHGSRHTLHLLELLAFGSCPSAGAEGGFASEWFYLLPPQSVEAPGKGLTGQTGSFPVLEAFPLALRSCRSHETFDYRAEHHAISGGCPIWLSAGSGHVLLIPTRLFHALSPCLCLTSACDGIRQAILWAGRSPWDRGLGMLFHQGQWSPGAVGCS